MKHRITILLVVLLMAACGSASTPTPTPRPTPTQRPTDLGTALVAKPSYPSITYGIQAFLWWNPVTRALDLEHVRLMNFSHVKQIIAWQAVQPDPKLAYDWSHIDAILNDATYRGIHIIARVDSPPDWALTKTGPFPLDLTAWGTFCHDLAAHYAGKIAGYQIWNEPNLAREWFGRTPDAAGYVKLLQTCYTQMKAADPNAIVISAGLSPTGTTSDAALPDDRYLGQMFAAGLSGAYDVLGLNAPGYKSPPDMDPGDPSVDGQRWQVFRHVEDMRAIQVANGDGAKQIAILEMGWTLDTVHSDYAWFAVTEDQQAQYLVGAYRYAVAHWRPWIGLMTTIYLPDPDWTEKDEQYWWSIATPGYHPIMRPAYIDLANMEKVSGDNVIPARGPGEPITDHHAPLPPPSATPK